MWTCTTPSPRACPARLAAARGPRHAKARLQRRVLSRACLLSPRTRLWSRGRSSQTPLLVRIELAALHLKSHWLHRVKKACLHCCRHVSALAIGLQRWQGTLATQNSPPASHRHMPQCNSTVFDAAGYHCLPLGLAECPDAPTPQERPAQAPRAGSSVSTDSERTQIESEERPQARPAHCFVACARLLLEAPCQICQSIICVWRDRRHMQGAFQMKTFAKSVASGRG